MAKANGFYHEIKRFQNATNGTLRELGSIEIPAHTLVAQTQKVHNRRAMLQKMDKALEKLATEWEEDPTLDLFEDEEDE
jgi:hypothetical protein